MRVFQTWHCAKIDKTMVLILRRKKVTQFLLGARLWENYRRKSLRTSFVGRLHRLCVPWYAQSKLEIIIYFVGFWYFHSFTKVAYISAYRIFYIKHTLVFTSSVAQLLRVRARHGAGSNRHRSTLLPDPSASILFLPIFGVFWKNKPLFVQRIYITLLIQVLSWVECYWGTHETQNWSRPTVVGTWQTVHDLPFNF